MKFHAFSRLLPFLLSPLGTVAQQPGSLAEEKPTITLKECTVAGGCTSRQAKLTLDANWRWIHEAGGYDNCYTGDSWDTGICSDPEQCAQNCALEGVSRQQYENTYGIKQVQDGVRLNFVTDHQYGSNVGSRLYVMEDDENYAMFYLKNREFSFEVDVSELYCGMNGAMYFTEMQANGGRGIGNNNAGAKYGTGYCDAQCPHDMKFIDGEANVIDWAPNPNDQSNNMGAGKYGACCAEMDIWEANSMASAFTPHTCSTNKLHRCSDPIECGDNASGNRYDGVCDKDGCDINPYRMGVEDFYGRGDQYAVNTLKPMTVVTQFLTTDGTDEGDFSEMRRLYIQDGQVVHSPPSTILGPGKESDSITDQFCDDKKDLFGDVKDYQEHGGMTGMGESLDRGHAMIFSLWDDVEVNMLWLDSAYPLDRPITDPGIKRGDCPGGETSTPTYLRQTYPNGGVVFKNAAVGEIGSTYEPPAPTAPTPPPTPNPAGPQCDVSGCCSQDFASCVPWCGSTKNECLSCNQDVGWICGEQNDCKPRWHECSNDPNGCCDGLTCVEANPGYSQCRVGSPSPPPPTPKPTGQPSPPPTNAPTKTPTTSSTGCFSNNYKDCLPEEYSNDPTSCTTVWLPNGSRENCIALWGDCADLGSDDCCGNAVCFGDASYSACVPPTDSEPTTPGPTTSQRTPLPTPGPTASQPTPPNCIVCDDRESNWMIPNGFKCHTDTVRIDKNCNKKASWSSKKFCQLSCYKAGNGYEGDVCCVDDSPPPADDDDSTANADDSVDDGDWENGLSLTHYWDCSGQSCDAPTLQPWDYSKYRAAKGYQPQDPNDFGGPIYGEKLWVTGAVMNIDLGPSDSCCGETEGGGCGKCILVSNPQSVKSDWKAIVMKKNTCGSCVSGPHIDVNVPGFDVLQYSLANICGEPGTGLTKEESATLGQWYLNHDNTKEAQGLCDQLPLDYQKGCRLFTEWGWVIGNPSNASYKVVECPQAYVDFIGDQFDEGGLTTLN